MAIHPVDTTRKIKTDYENYLRSILKVKSPELTRKAYSALAQSEFVKGPYLESTPPFVTGCALSDLMAEGKASQAFRTIAEEAAIHRPLYLHQETSFQKITEDKRNIIVSTGTGSGKTECFLYPIFNELMREKEDQRLSPGVRALLLYPMNALANDQIKRLRSLLESFPDITFGRYTGETIESQDKALEAYQDKQEQEFKARGKVRGMDYTKKDLLPLPNELISREEMRKSPPHILLTNYAMLEYLLIRPDDTTFFDGPMAESWRFLVLDEAHTYKGANGTEIALLIRRLKERVCEEPTGQLQCIATSATLGSKDGLQELANFARDIFGEEFTVDDIVTSERVRRPPTEAMVPFSLEKYRQLQTEVRGEKDASKANAWLHEELSKDQRILDLLKCLESRPGKVTDVADLVFPDLPDSRERLEGLVHLIELGSRARPGENHAAMIPARYHLFVRALEGFYVSLFPESQVHLDRKEYLAVAGQKIPVFELANCQDCGQEYLIGMTRNGRLVQPVDGESLDYYLLSSDSQGEDPIEADSDEAAFEPVNVDKVEKWRFCTACGTIIPDSMKRKEACCEIQGTTKYTTVYKMIPKRGTREVNTCASCGHVGRGLITRFLTANQPSTYILASSLYSMIPPEKVQLPDPSGNDLAVNESFFDFEEDTAEAVSSDESGRKLLVFSDNRQEAAFFAAYMSNKYNQLMWRRLMLRELKTKPEGMNLKDLINNLAIRGRETGLAPELSLSDRELIAGIYLMKEFTRFERNKGLEGSGYLKFRPDLPPIRRGAWGFTGEELTDLIQVFMDTLRFSGATSYPSNIDPERDEFAPRNRNVFFRKSGSGNWKKSTIQSFVPADSANNRRIDYLKKILDVRGTGQTESRAQALNILNQIYDQIISPLAQKGYFRTTTVGEEGVLRQLDHTKWIASALQDEEQLYVCDRCGRIAAHNIADVCPEFRCSGILQATRADAFRDDPYYAPLYTSDQLQPMVAREHTGQLTRDAAGSIQSKFEAGEINILSCTTTFEMGVDVGQLEAILLRNVPPETSNYVQRAGRAGRRTSSTAFSVTYARRNSHDLHYYQNPTEIISGRIKSPYIELNNDKIAARHVNSIVLAWFFRRDSETREYFKGRVNALVGRENQVTIVDKLMNELDQKPPELIVSIEKVLTPEMMETLKIRDWDFVSKLIGKDGVLSDAIAVKGSELKTLDGLYTERSAKRAPTDSLRRLINTFEKQATLNFLASSGVIPKYGFPIDVVKLDILDNSAEAMAVDLSRDLKMAVSEFAPGSQVIAAGKVWTSHAINRIWDKEWPAYRFYECPECKKSTFPDDLTTIEDQDQEVAIICPCGGHMRPRTMIIPIFGFSTAWNETGKVVGDSRPRRFYPTRVQFGGFDDPNEITREKIMKKEIPIGEQLIHAKCAPQGKLVVMNRGTTGCGLFICKSCGYASSIPNQEPHKTKMGTECRNRYLTCASLGHIFQSDVLRLEFPEHAKRDFEDKDQWTTLLYAILEGASDALGIARDDINGCMDYRENTPAIILFDETPGGAGHVRRIYDKLDAVLLAAYRRVDGHCHCGEETACYGCLRGYSNQLDHEVLARGLAKDYLMWLLIETEPLKRTVAIPDLNKRSGVFNESEWKRTLQEIMSTGDEESFHIAKNLYVQGIIPAPDSIEYVLREEGTPGFEAAMAWTEQKVALITNEDQDSLLEIKKAFQEANWTIITKNSNANELVEVFKIAGLAYM